jgi:nucleoid-associated protein YgaU
MGDDKVDETGTDGLSQWAAQNTPEVAEATEAAAPPVAEEISVEMPAMEAAPAARPARSASAHAEPAHREKAAPRPPKRRQYTVKSGDTLSAIGQHFGVSWQKIARVNNIENPDLIFPGQTFVIPD